MRFTSFRWQEFRVARVLLLSVLCLAVAPDLAVSKSQATSVRKMTDALIVHDLRAHLDRLTARDDFSGAVLLAHGDQILFEHAHGFANHAFNARNKADTKFNLGSMGKMFTAVAVLQLAQQGKLSLSDTVLKLVPDYPDKEIARKVTVEQLLTHTSGLGDFFNEKFAKSSRANYRTTESYLPLFVGEPLLFEPGTRFSYSNTGFAVLGLVIEHVSGETYHDYVREHIFEPAGMLDTDNYNVDDDVPNLALGYTHAGADGRPHPERPRRTNVLMHVGRGGAPGGGYSTVGDLLRFARALQGHKLLNKKSTELLMTGKVNTARGGDKYAFGMVEAIVNGARIVGHGGGFPGINGRLDMYPDLGYTVVVLANYDDAAEDLSDRLRWDLTGGEVPHAVHLSAEALKALAGSYAPAPPPGAPKETRGMPPGPIEIAADTEGLWLNARGRKRFLPLGPAEFFDESYPGDRLMFTKDEQGRIISLTVKRAGPGPTMTAIRLP